MELAPETIGDCKLVHIGCFLDQHPELGKALDVARRHGKAIRDRDTWTASMSAGPRRTS